MAGGGHALGTAARTPVHRKKDGFPRRSAPRNDRKPLSLRGGPQGRRAWGVATANQILFLNLGCWLRRSASPSPKAPLWKGGRLRAPPVAEEASKKEWQRSKFCERMRAKNFGHRNRSCHGFAVTEGLSGVAGPFWGWSLPRFPPIPCTRWRRHSAVRRYPGQSRRLSATTRRARRPGVPSLVPPQGVGADAHD